MLTTLTTPSIYKFIQSIQIEKALFLRCPLRFLPKVQIEKALPGSSSTRRSTSSPVPIIAELDLCHFDPWDLIKI
jgi:hypothetical protein